MNGRLNANRVSRSPHSLRAKEEERQQAPPVQIQRLHRRRRGLRPHSRRSQESESIRRSTTRRDSEATTTKSSSSRNCRGRTLQRTMTAKSLTGWVHGDHLCQSHQFHQEQLHRDRHTLHLHRRGLHQDHHAHHRQQREPPKRTNPHRRDSESNPLHRSQSSLRREETRDQQKAIQMDHQPSSEKSELSATTSTS